MRSVTVSIVWRKLQIWWLLNTLPRPSLGPPPAIERKRNPQKSIFNWRMTRMPSVSIIFRELKSRWVLLNSKKPWNAVQSKSRVSRFTVSLGKSYDFRSVEERWGANTTRFIRKTYDFPSQTMQFGGSWLWLDRISRLYTFKGRLSLECTNIPK